MAARRFPVISARKAPRQARSVRLVEDTLEAAIRVLAREGARRFTTARVAEEAGVSVGSLYQYFPNKEAILFRLQTDEWRRTAALLDGILADVSRGPMQRLRDTVLAFFRSEWDEAALRLALADAAPAYRAAPEVLEHRGSGKRRTLRFMAELLPDVAPQRRKFAGEVIMTVMSSLGKSVSEQARSQVEVESWAHVVAEMLCSYVERETTGEPDRRY
jgi:AcrR family transcriptional regulator